MNQYEAMFLFDPTFGATIEACEAEINRVVVERAGGEVLFCRKWDERRLAYRIAGRKRGVYVLAYVKLGPDKIGAIERDVQISEKMLRILILRADHITPEMMELSMTHREVPSDRYFNDKGNGRPDGASKDKPADKVVEHHPAAGDETATDADTDADGEGKGDVEDVEEVEDVDEAAEASQTDGEKSGTE